MINMIKDANKMIHAWTWWSLWSDGVLRHHSISVIIRFRMKPNGYWLSFSFCVMFSTCSCSIRMPRAQRWASSWLWQRRSKLFRGPLKTTVKQWPSVTDPAICRKVSEWQPSRTHSTSITETGEKDNCFKIFLHKTNLLLKLLNSC